MITLEKEKKCCDMSFACQLNVNMFWAHIIMEVLERLGVTHVVSSPGSRSVPLTFASALNKRLKTIPVLDERSAGFFALGLAKQTHRPVALICSSGTAAANFYPAIIEARMTRVPLIVLTADRPPELRECHSGQTIDQVKLYGDYPLFYKELAVPRADVHLFCYLRQMVGHAYERSLFPQAGPVHLNVSFSDPYPVLDEGFGRFLEKWDREGFFNQVARRREEFGINGLRGEGDFAYLNDLFSQLRGVKRGLIVVGTVQPRDARRFAESVGWLAGALGWPVLAEGLSPVRNYADAVPMLITRYDCILRNKKVAEILAPEQVIQIGDFPTSKVLRAWLAQVKPRTYVLEASKDNIDPLHGNTRTFRLGVEALADWGCEGVYKGESDWKSSEYASYWERLERQANAVIGGGLRDCEALFEGKVAWELSRVLPEETPIFVATSMPVRDVEFFWEKGNSRIQLYFNRGANGIDGLVSTALGVAHENRPSVLLVGDLSLLHDCNGLLIKNYFKGSLTIVLINNGGGRIFENLPAAQFGEVFENYIVTPQEVDFKKFADNYGVDYYCPKTWDAFRNLVSELPDAGIRIIEIITDSKFDVAFRKKLFQDACEKLKND